MVFSIFSDNYIYNLEGYLYVRIGFLFDVQLAIFLRFGRVEKITNRGKALSGGSQV